MISDVTYTLAPLFFIVAMLYSMVGFGGGSSYIALFILFGISYTLAPATALVCNIVVVAGSIVQFWYYRRLDFKFFLPFIIFSIPLSFLGGLIPLDRTAFQAILGSTLCLAGLKMIFFSPRKSSYQRWNQKPPFLISSFIGGGVGLLSGMVGIGGGIFLTPILYMLKWGEPKKIAALASTFIFVNSIAGLAGQLQKSGNISQIYSFWPLFLVVLLGGHIGGQMCNRLISRRHVEILTSVLILFVSTRLIVATL